MAGAAGGLFAAVSSFISPESFPFSQSIAFLLIVMIGGAGAVAGPVYGALIVVFAPEIFSWLAEYRVLTMGVLFLIVLLAAPGGIASLLDLAIGRIVNLWSSPAGTAGLQRAPKAQPFFTPELRKELIVKGLDVRFGGVHAVKGVSFTARAGEITSLVGPNGAGKSTVINLICGFNKPQAGAVFLGDAEITGLPAHQRARQGVARTFQTAQLFSRLSAGSNVAIAATGGKLTASPFFLRRAYRSPGGEVAALLSFAGYDGPLDREAGALPHGGRRLTEIARALALRPTVLALDEPAAGLDIAAKQRLGEVLRQIAACGVAVLLIEHDMDLVMSVSTHIVVLDAGAKIAEGTPQQIRTNPEVKKAYLGEEVKNPKLPSAAKSLEGAPVLTARSLQSGYGANLVLRDVSLDVRRGETVAILGANGAGKTTLLRTLAGLNSVRGGAIAFKDRAIAQLPAEGRAQAGLVLVPEGRQVFPELSVIDNLMLGAVHQPKSEAWHKAEALLARFPHLQNRRHQRAGLLSGGEQQMLAIARGLIANPDVLMLDEPSLGLAPLAVEAVYEWFGALQDGSLTIVIADQLAPMALALAERAYVLRGGRVVYEGESTRLASDPDLLRTYYLGEAAEAL
jgi:ABC-type branched-subunit amino acid transport system ATPase component